VASAVDVQGSSESLLRSIRAGNDGACGHRVPPWRRCNLSSAFYYNIILLSDGSPGENPNPACWIGQ
jgi:hypothetical protein